MKMSGGGKDAVPAPAPSGPGRGRPKKVRPRESEPAGVVSGIGAEVKRRRKIATAGGDTRELGASTAGASAEQETSSVELKNADQANTRVNARSQKHPMNKRKQNELYPGGSDGGIGSVLDHGREVESQDDGKGTALDLVLKVHGVVVHATERAAAFPGETGQGSLGESNLCACCSKPEVSKQTIVCDGCERSFHITCLKLALQSATDIDDWICTSCSASYPESEVSAGVSKAVRENLERILFSRERKTSDDDVGVHNEVPGTACSSVGVSQSEVPVAATSEHTEQDLVHTNGPNVPDGDQQRQDSSNQSVPPETDSLDPEKANNKVSESISRKSVEDDLDRSMASDSVEEVTKAEQAKSPEAEIGPLNVTVVPDSPGPSTAFTEITLAESASEIVELSEEIQPTRAEESSCVNEVMLSVPAGMSTVSGPKVSCTIVEECAEGGKHSILAESSSLVESRPHVILEELQVTEASTSMLSSVEPTVVIEKEVTCVSTLEVITSVSDIELPVPVEDPEVLNDMNQADSSAEPTVAREEKIMDSVVAGQIMPVVESNLSGSPDESEDSSISLSTKSSPDLTVAKEVAQASPVLDSREADNAAVERVPDEPGSMTEVTHVQLSGTFMLQESDDSLKCISTDNLAPDETLCTTKPSETEEKGERMNGSRLLEHIPEGLMCEPRNAGEPVGVLELGGQNVFSTSPRVATSPTSSADVAGVRPECQQSKKSRNKSPIGYPDRVSITSVGPNSTPARKGREEASPSGTDDPQLKKFAVDTLQQLRDSIREKHGLVLAEGWEVDVKRRRNEKHLDKYYISPEKHRFRSRIEVMKHLGLWDGLKSNLFDKSKAKHEVQTPQSKEWLSLLQQLSRRHEELQPPFKLGDLVIESLGHIALQRRYWDELHIWPVGYRCTWHDRTTSSFCVSEVADGGSSQPIFRVSRKFCLTVVELGDVKGAPVDVNVDIPEKTRKDSPTKEVGTKTSPVDNPSSGFHRVKNPFGSVYDVEEEESLKALLGDMESFPSTVQYENVKVCEDSRIADGTCNPDTTAVLEKRDDRQPRDIIGEFSVEASSTAEAWKLYAEQFVERFQKASENFGPLLMMCTHETPAAVEPVTRQDLESKDLLQTLSQDRFGLNETLVIGLIERLLNSDKCSGYKSLKQRGLSWRAQEPVEVTVQPPRLRIREKARKHRKAPEVSVEDGTGAAELADVIVKDAIGKDDIGKDAIGKDAIGKDGADVSVLRGERPPPPPGHSLRLRLPSEYVGDVLQIWEFLGRFSNLIGFPQPPMLEDLEKGLICGSASVSACVDASPPLEVGTDCMAANRKFQSDKRRDSIRNLDIPDVAPRSTSADTSGSPRTPMKSLLPGRTLLSSTTQGSQQNDVSRVERLWDEDGKTVSGCLSNDGNSLMEFEPDVVKGRAVCADVHPKSESKVMDERGIASAASLHVPLMKFLLSDLQSKVCGFEEFPGDSEESKHKRGRKRIRDTGSNLTLGREKLIGSFSINEVTWPEVARRYIISLSRISKIGENAEYRREECMKILRCIQGDGGVLCGALDGVAGMEIDAQLLAEAEKEISTLMLGNEDTAAPTTPPQNGASREVVEEARGQDSSGESALWVKLLDPIAKLPTNVGSRIRNRVIDALAANPPAWAAEMLTYSISKKVYKGNASGPTKRAVMEVLHKYRGEDPDPKLKKTKKQRKRVLPSPEVVMQRCRIVLRQVATADTLRVVSKSYRCMTNFYESEGEGLLARPLDFRAIDLRLGAGAYGTSPDAFAADVKQIWRNVATLYDSGSIEASAASELAELFNTLYNKQVLVFQRGGDQAALTGSDGQNAGDLNQESEKNPADSEKPPGSDVNKPVKAPWEDDSCQVCGIDDDHDNVLLCDGCDAEYHIYCLNPPLPEVPDGNWFCHSCVAVDTGFLEAPSAPESGSEAKLLDKQEDHHQLRGQCFEDITEKDQLRRSDASVHSALRALVLKLAETDYWHLTLAERVYLLKWLCDQALETPKLRSHLEKSMEVALDLQQRLRTLLVERRRNADQDDARPDSSREGPREVNILPIFQARGANSKRPDEFDEESSVQVDVVDGLSVSGLSTGAVGMSRVLQSDPTEFVWPEGHAALLATGAVRPNDPSGSTGSAKLSRGEQEEKDVASDQSTQIAVFQPMEVDCFPSSALLRSVVPLKEGPKGGVQACSSERIVESGDLKVVGTPTGVSADRIRKNAESPVHCSPLIVVEPRNLTSSWDEVLEARSKRPKDEPLACPEVEVEVEFEETTLPRSSSSFLDAEIEKIKTKLMRVNSRRDLLGRDDIGRMYWGLCGSRTTPWLAVEAADASNQSQAEDREGLTAGAESVVPVNSNVHIPLAEKFRKDDVSEKQVQLSRLAAEGLASHVRENEERDSLLNEAQRRLGEEVPWFIYSNGAVLDQLIEWLSPTSNQEKMLKAALLQWRSLLLVYSGAGPEQAGGLREELSGCFVSGIYGSNTFGDMGVRSQVVAKSRRGITPALKASCLLEWKLGQVSDSSVKGSATSGLSKRGRKKKMQQSSKITRCECLEPIWASRCHCSTCHTTYDTDLEFQAHTTGGTCSNAGTKAFEHGDLRSGKKSGHSTKSLTSTKVLKSAVAQQPSIGIILPPDVSKMPMVIRESMRERINRIGCIADKGPIFTPGLAISPAFDPALMMFDTSRESMLLMAGESVSVEGILGTIAVGATSCMSHGDVDNSLTGYRILISSSEDLPGPAIEASEGTEAAKTIDHMNARNMVPTTNSVVQEHAGLLASDGKGLTTTNEDFQMNQTQPAVSAPSLGRTLSGAHAPPYESSGNLSRCKAYSRNFKVTGKQLTIPEASLRPLEDEEDLEILQQLKMKLLDIEAAVSQDMSESARGYSRRRQAWRSLLKFAKSIYTMVQAVVLLEQMICADFLRTSWCYWSSFTVAAKTATLSSLYLRVYALDAAIEFEKSEHYAGVDFTLIEGIQGRREKERDDRKHSQSTKFTARKKRKEEVIVILEG
ncbi:methyl-CpG-binding domain-containing protein 9 [Marchantia polymorpha subsp. ruderalis]